MAQLPGLAQAKWTNQILDEMLDARQKNLPHISAEKAEQLRDRMNRAVRDCLVTGYEPLVGSLELPDPDGKHVLAAAIKAGAQVVVTWNLKDFPQERLAPGTSGPSLPKISFSTGSGLTAKPYGRASSRLWIRAREGQ